MQNNFNRATATTDEIQAHDFEVFQSRMTPIDKWALSKDNSPRGMALKKYIKNMSDIKKNASDIKTKRCHICANDNNLKPLQRFLCNSCQRITCVRHMKNGEKLQKMKDGNSALCEEH